MKHLPISKYLLLSTAFISLGTQALAQTSDENSIDDEIIVTGTHIKGARVTETLPVTIFNAGDLDSLGSFDGEDLIRSLPGQGEIDFRDDNNNTVNNSRGDISSINLRSIGPGNTLVLLNSRRVVNHPGTQTKNRVPAVTVNMNALPVAGIRRVEVLNDGASAIYGSDAVAGVFNAVLKDNFEGLTTSFRATKGEHTGLNEQQLTVNYGKNFNEDRTNISVAASYSVRNGLNSDEIALSANSDSRDLLIGTSFEGDTSFDNRHTRTAWGQFTLRTGSSTRVRQNGTTLTTSSGRFHIQPDTFAGCRGTTADDLATDGICIDDSSLDRDLRHNRGADRSLISDRDRLNAFVFLNHELNSNVELYGELGYYRAETDATIEAITPISSGDIVVPRNNYWNPFGPVRFSDGTLNPNRLPGLTNVPDEGLPVYVDGARIRLTELGKRNVNVVNTTFRILGGARGYFGGSSWAEGWDWDSATLYSRARTTDITDNRVSSTLFAAALDNETPNAFNLFNGADPNNPNSLDSTTNPQSVIDTFLIDVQRQSTTELALIDFKVSKGDLYELPAGSIGAAFGVEARYESYDEDRDDRLDGTITFTNPVTGDFTASDAMGSSPTFDSNGSREVYSAFGELLIPVIGENQNIPLMRRLDAQLAVRIEEFSDIGSSGLKPRIAGTWEVFDWLKGRASWSEGFRAPNLQQINELGVARSNTNEDSIFCEAGVRNGTFATFADCDGYTESREERRDGNKNLSPEDDENLTFGIVIDPVSLQGPLSFLNGFTATIDWWDIKQQGVVGIFGGANHVDLDYALRLQGSSNANVVRAAPTVDQIAFFAGTGIDAVGDILYIDDQYLNLLPRDIRGVDYAVYYKIHDTALGDFDVKVNAARMKRFYVQPSPRALIVTDAVDAGLIDPSISVSGAGSLIEVNGTPKYRGSANLTWRHPSGFGGGARVNYVGKFIDTSAGLNSDGEPHRIKDWATGNVYVQYETDRDGILNNSRVRFGINNVTNEAPRHDDEIRGYKSSMHSVRGRAFYVDISKKF
ncbi:MAG: TonB-dependent receptor [Robiginitomaculum sp.]|nr:MAG: TonB-dependent receptor [Robiginitomaculum sp.]